MNQQSFKTARTSSCSTKKSSNNGAKSQSKGKKNGQNRPSSSDLKFADSMIGDESLFRLNSDDSSFPTFSGGASETSTDLDSTKWSGGSSNNSYRYSI